MKKIDISPKFQIKAVKTLDFCITPPQVKKEKEIHFTVRLKTEFLVKVSKNIFAIRLSIEIFIKENDKIASIRTEIYFEIDNLEQFLVKGNAKELVLPDILMSTLLNISIGTTRGILVTKVAGTALDYLVMPAIPIKPFIPKEPIKINKEEPKKKK